MLRALAEIGTVDVVMLGEPDAGLDAIFKVCRDVRFAYPLEICSRPNGLCARLKWTFDASTHYPDGRKVVDGGVHHITRILREFDCIWFFKQRCADMFPNMAWPRSVMDIDDVPSTYERAALRIGGPSERLLALRRLFVWRRRERLLGHRFSVLTVCSEEDKEYLRRIGVHTRVHVIPNGYEKPPSEPLRNPVAPPRIGFIGNFGYFPNREGVIWFLKECWPWVKREVPQARLRLIGQDSNKLPEVRDPDVDRLGALSDPAEEIKSWYAMIVPIRLGAGTRVKIAHGFSEKCPIVSTTIGARGYNAVDGRQMYLANSAKPFAQACVRTIDQPEEAAQVAERAWIEFLNKWTWDSIRPRIWAAAEDCLRLNACRQ